MSKDITEMSYAELLEHKRLTEELLKQQKDDAISKTAEDVKILIEQSGFTLAEVLPKLGVKDTSKKAPAETKSKKAAVYFHPENSELGWSGMGRAPSWIKDYLGVSKVSLKDPEVAEKLEKLRK